MSTVNEMALAQQVADRLERLLSDPNATSLQVVDGLLAEGLPIALPVPPERAHRILVHALSEAVQSNAREWLLEAAQLFLSEVGLPQSV